MNTGVNVKEPEGSSDSTPEVGPLTSVVTVEPTVGGMAPLQPISFVTTELTRIELMTMVKKSSVALGQGPEGRVVGVSVEAVVVVDVAEDVVVATAVANDVVVVVVCTPHPAPQHTS